MKAAERTCPTCRQTVIVTADRIEEHHRLSDQRVRGVLISQRCTASSQSYIRLLMEALPCAV